MIKYLETVKQSLSSQPDEIIRIFGLLLVVDQWRCAKEPLQELLDASQLPVLEECMVDVCKICLKGIGVSVQIADRFNVVYSEDFDFDLITDIYLGHVSMCFMDSLNFLFEFLINSDIDEVIKIIDKHFQCLEFNDEVNVPPQDRPGGLTHYVDVLRTSRALHDQSECIELTEDLYRYISILRCEP